MFLQYNDIFAILLINVSNLCLVLIFCYILCFDFLILSFKRNKIYYETATEIIFQLL